MARTSQQQSEYNKRYYRANKDKLLAHVKSRRTASKIKCPICGELMDARSELCNRCAIIKRNQSEKQRNAVSVYWTGRSRDEWLDGWRNNEMAQLTSSEVSMLDMNWIRLLAWILTDGSIRKRWGNVVIYQTKDRGKCLIRQILNELGLIFKEYEYATRPGEVTFYIPSKYSRVVLGTLRMSVPKRLPDWAKYMSNHQTEIFLNSLLDGDGHRSKYSTSLYGLKEMLTDIYQLLKEHDISCSLNYNKGECYYIQIHQKQGL